MRTCARHLVCKLMMGLGTRAVLQLLLRGRALPIATTAVMQPHCFIDRFFSSESQQHLFEDALYRKGASHTAYHGVIAAVLGEDRGRGLIARHSCEPGDLVMCVQPAAVVTGEADNQPDPEFLVPALLEAARQPQVLAALSHLYDGTDTSKQQLPALSVMAMDRNSSSSSSCCPDHDHDHDHDHHHKHEHEHAHGHNHHDHNHEHEHAHGHQHHQQHDLKSTASSSSSSTSAAVEPDFTLEKASQLVRYNAFGDSFEDLAAAAVRSAPMPHSHVGCWPAFCLLNHSCIPNTVHYVVGQNMVVRATDDVPAGQELTVSYLGREDFAPAGARKAVLQERFGFDCDCQRCRLEQKAPEQLQQLVEQTYSVVQQELKPAFMQAVEQQDGSSLSKVHAALLQQEDQLSAALQDNLAALGPSAVLVLQAAVYDLYELLLFADQLGPGSSPEVAHRSLARLGRCIAVVNCVGRGSELHVYLTSRMLHHALDLRGADSVQAEAAAALLQEAHMLRYGKNISQHVLLGLIEANKQAAQDFLM